MNRITLTISMFIVAVYAMSASLTFNGNTRPVFSETPPPSTGIDNLYVLYDLEGVTMQYTAESSDVMWYRYGNLGGGYAEEVTDITRNGNVYTLKSIDSDMGYIIEDGINRHYFWIIDYSKHYFGLDALNINTEQECDVVLLNPIGNNTEAIKYYTINGQSKELDRNIVLSYRTLTFDADVNAYVETGLEKSYSSLSQTIVTTAPLCNTDFRITGDRFLKFWGEEISIDSEQYNTIAVSAHTTVSQAIRENDNEKSEETVLGGSAPVEIEFDAVCSDAVVFKEWQFSTDPEFENITLRMSDLSIVHVFKEQGTSYVRFAASNNAGSCDYYSDVYEVYIGESSLECPNAFSPDATEGINDEWKVSYKSIISFQCHIFNRWGIKVAELNDPSQGWDGKYDGKYVPAGVYYYVIKAEGADGRSYDLKGDINIIKYKYSGTSTQIE